MTSLGTISQPEISPVLELLNTLTFKSMQSAIFSLNSLESLNQYTGWNLDSYLLILPAMISMGFQTPWPLLLQVYYFFMCPLFAFIYLVLPESVTNIPEQTFWYGLFFAPLNWFMSIHVYTIERNLQWLIWFGYDYYTKEQNYSRKRGILFLEFWFYLIPICLASLLTAPILIL